MFPSYVPENTEQIVNQDAGFMTKKSLDVEEHNNTMVDLLRYGLPATAVGLFDDVLQSLTPDSLVTEETVTNMFDDLQHGLGAYYKENREGAQTAGALIGSFIPIVGATKLVRGGGYLDKILGSSKTGNFLRKSLITSGRTRTDRVMQMNAEAATFFPKGKVLSLQDDGTQEFYRHLKGNQWQAAADMAKETLAADLAIGLFFNDSDVFFPEDLSAMTNAALFLVPDALLTGLSYRFTGTHIKKELMRLDQEGTGIPQMLAEALNPKNLPQTDLLYREGKRGPAIAVEAVNANIARNDRANAGTNIDLGKSGGQRLEAARSAMAEQFVRIFNDNPYGNGITHSTTKDVGSGEIQNLLKHIETDPSLIVPVVSAEQMHAQVQTQYFRNLLKRTVDLDDQITLQKTIVDSESATDIARRNAADKMEALKDERKIMDSLQDPVVLETDGSITPLRDRKWSVVDNPSQLKLEKTSDAGEQIIKLSKGEALDVGMEMGVTEHGKLLIQPLAKEKKNTALGGIPTVQIFTTHTREQIEREFREEMSFNLHAAGRDWHYEKGQLGREVFETLTPQQQSALRSWRGSSNASPIRSWGGDHPELQEITAAYRQRGFERQMHEIADEQGRVLLYRGQSKGETANPTNDIVSVSTNPKIARAFAGSNGDVLKMMVPVEDILFPIGGAGDEFEFVVKNQVRRMQSRNLGEDVIQSAVGSVQEEAITAMSWRQRAVAHAMMQKQLNNYNPDKQGILTVHPGSSWMELDFAVQLMRKYPDREVVRMAAGGSAAQPNFRDLVFETLAHKFEELQKLEMIRRKNADGILKLTEDQALSMLDNARILNLPTGTAGGQHPLITTFQEMIPLQGGEIRSLRSFVENLDELDAAMVKHVNKGRLLDGEQELRNDLKYWGNMLTADYDEALRPSLLVQRGKSQRFGPDEIAMRIAANKTWQNAMFAASKAKNAPFVAAIVEELLAHPAELRQATRPDLILEIPPINKGIAGQQSQVYLGNPVLENLDRIVDLTEKRALKMTSDMFDEFTPVFNKLLSQNQEASLDLVNNAVNSLRQGWRVLKKHEALEGETNRYILKLDTEHPFNQKRYKELFGRDLAQDAIEFDGVVPVPIRASTVEKSGELPTPLVLDDLALTGMAAITEMSHRFLDNLNHLRAIRHLKPLNKKPWHIPAINMKAGSNVYLVDGRGVVQGVINRPTAGEAWRAADKEARESARDGRQWVPMAEDTIMRYHDTLGDVWDDTRSFQYSEFQTGPATGKSGGVAIETGDAPLKGLIEALQANFALLTRHTRATFFESELNYTRSFITANSAVPKNVKLAKSTQHQAYENVLLQRPALNPNGYVGKFYYAVESVVDDLMRGLWDHVNSIKTPTAAASGRDFERMQKMLGDYNPFKNVDDMIRKTEKTHTPPSMRKAVSKLNGFTTDMVLRIFDMGMPLINFASLLSVTPAVMNAMRRGKGETKDAWLSRIGAIGSPIDEDYAIPHTGRLVAQGIDGFFSAEAKEIRDLAAARGYLKQEVAERLNLWTRPKEGYLKSSLDNAVDFLSKPTDWSENMSRDIAFRMAYKVGRDTFKLQKEESMLFAHVHANKIIGDFRPNNRPQMFQGAAGMPLGLFTTWAINWLQRVFGDLEAGRLGAVGWQAAVQQFLFGAESMPGVSDFIEKFTASYDGKRNMTDSMDQMYGRDFTDWFLHGSLSSLTGVAVQSRADVSLPAIMTGESFATAVPSVSVMRTLYEGLGESFKSVRENGGFNGREMSEIISVYGVNGFARNLAQVLQGQAVDRRGATINANVRDFESTLARAFELKSMRETRKAREIYRDRMQQVTERGHIDRLSKRLRAASRGGNIDADLMNDAVMAYIEAGGSPDYFSRYLKQQIMIAQFDSATRLLLKALRQNDEQGKAMRLMNILMEQ